MKPEFIEAVTRGKVVKSNTFETECGRYAIDILTYKGELYFYKSKNGKIVECLNLTEMSKGIE